MQEYDSWTSRTSVVVDAVTAAAVGVDETGEDLEYSGFDTAKEHKVSVRSFPDKLLSRNILSSRSCRE